jgi:hypothetical protein
VLAAEAGAYVGALDAGGGVLATGEGVAAAFGFAPAEERGQVKSSARPEGADSASPRTKTLAAVGSPPVGDEGREPAPKRSPPSPPRLVASGSTGPIAGRGAPGAATAGANASGPGNATGTTGFAITRLNSCST